MGGARRRPQRECGVGWGGVGWSAWGSGKAKVVEANSRGGEGGRSRRGTQTLGCACLLHMPGQPGVLLGKAGALRSLYAAQACSTILGQPGGRLPHSLVVQGVSRRPSKAQPTHFGFCMQAAHDP